MGWAPGAGAEAHLVHIGLQLNEPVRQQALQGVMAGRALVGQGVAEQPPGGAPFNPQALAQAVGLYFDMFDTFVKGLDRLDVDLDLGEQTLVAETTARAVPGSDLTGWFKARGNGIGGLASYVDPNAAVSFAMSIGADAPYLTLMKKLARVSLELQNQPLDEATASQFDQMMDVFVPSNSVLSMDFGQGTTLVSVSEFPGRDIAGAYASFKQLFVRASTTLAGPGKLYSAFEFKEGFRTVAGRPVDRLTLQINLDSPAFQMPGQRESMERMWPGGKSEFEYAVRDNRLYLASPARMENLLSAPPPSRSASAVGLTANTALVGQVNLLTLMKQLAAGDPTMAAPFKGNLTRIDPAGSQIRFRVDLDGNLTERVEVPLRFFEVVRQLIGQMPGG
jgi:hypothetical protein